MEYVFEDGEKEGELIDLRFTWESNLIKQQIRAVKGRSWLRFISKPSAPSRAPRSNKFFAVTISTNTPDPAQVLKGGMQVLGSTPMTIIAPEGEQLNISIATLGQEQELSLKFGAGEPEAIEVTFQDPALNP